MNVLATWTDGLQSNLIAEFVGLVCSIIATYFVVDRLIERSKRHHYLPLRQKLHRAAGQNLAALAHLWGFSLGKTGTRDLEEGLKRELGGVVEHLQSLVEADLQALETSAPARQDFIAARSETEVEEIARETGEDITAIGNVANRVSQIVSDDLELEGMLADLEADARYLDHVFSFAEYLSKASQSKEVPPLDLLVVLSLRCYRGAQEIWNHLNTLEAGKN